MTPRRKWGGTVLFAAILTVLGATVGLKLYATGETVTSSPVSAAQPRTSTPSATTPSATATPTPSATASASASAPEATATPAAPATRTIDGDVVNTRFGPVQVQITLSGSTITAVKDLQYPNGSGRDIEINDQALPILDQEVLQSQSANIDTVSGATYTSEGYIQSLQSALDKR